MPVDNHDWADLLKRVDRLQGTVAIVGDIAAFSIGVGLGAVVWLLTHEWNPVVAGIASVFVWGISVGVVRTLIDPGTAGKR